MCHEGLTLLDGGARWACRSGHSYDVARGGYVNLLPAGRRRTRQPGDSAEMVRARRSFLASGAYDELSLALSVAVAEQRPGLVLDVGCGEGRHTRRLSAPLILGVDVSKVAVSAAAKAHPEGWYAAASAAELPLGDGVVDVALNAFGPVVPAELARVTRPNGVVVTAHPGPQHLAALRALVYSDARPHEVKPPLRQAGKWFTETGSVSVGFSVVVSGAAQLKDLFSMTPYRWHAPQDIDERLATAAGGGFETVADIRVTSYLRTACG